jgi:hypothetical protein
MPLTAETVVLPNHGSSPLSGIPLAEPYGQPGQSDANRSATVDHELDGARQAARPENNDANGQEGASAPPTRNGGRQSSDEDWSELNIDIGGSLAAIDNPALLGQPIATSHVDTSPTSRQATSVPIIRTDIPANDLSGTAGNMASYSEAATPMNDTFLSTLAGSSYFVARRGEAGEVMDGVNEVEEEEDHGESRVARLAVGEEGDGPYFHVDPRNDCLLLALNSQLSQSQGL